MIVVPAAQTVQDSGVYGVIQSGDHKARTCVVKWVKLNAAGDDVEVLYFIFAFQCVLVINTCLLLNFIINECFVCRLLEWKRMLVYMTFLIILTSISA